MLRVVVFILLPLWLAASGAAGQEELSRAEVVRLQEALSGYDAGSADGVWGPASAAALRAYEADWGLPQDGTPTRDRLERLERRHAATRPQWWPAGAGCEIWNEGPQPQERATWTGGCVGGRAAGDGRLTGRRVFRGEAEEYVFDGGMAAGKQHGRGVYRYANGNVYEGDIIDGELTGRGVFRWAEGDVYEGDFIDGELTGRGVYRFANGAVYEGDFIDGALTGRGVYRWSNGDVYEGDFIDGKAHGRGVDRWANGASYVGDYQNNRPHGRGTYVSAEGTVYSGLWTNGCLRDGRGGKAAIGRASYEC